jgi:glucosaminylphosphatidylinositol acyltransferase
LDYPEHVSEYGVHWNFFFTIALLMPLASVASLFQSQPSWIVPVVVLTLYQYCLSMQGLQHWMEDAPRMCPSSVRMGGFPTNALLIFCDLWYANREGILGSISYAALYLISEWFAYAFFWRQKHRPSALTTNAVVTNAWNVTAKLWLVVLALFLLWQSFVNAGGFVVSRRSTNAIFCTWVLFVNVLQLVAIYTFVLLGSLYHLFNEIHLEPPPILAAVNRNGLSIFIIANLLTGLVNISINTLTVHNGTAVSILIIYVSTVGLVGVLIDHVMSNLRTFHQNVFGRQQEHISSQGKDQTKKEN